MIYSRPRTSARKGCSEAVTEEAKEIIQRGESKRQVAESLGMPG
jgi:hypothetical protein